MTTMTASHKNFDKVTDLAPFRIRGTSRDRKGLAPLNLENTNSSGIPQSNTFSVTHQTNNNFTLEAIGRKGTAQSKSMAYGLGTDDQHSNLIGNAKAGLAKMDAANKLQQAHNESNYTMSPTKFLNMPKNPKRNFLQKSMKSINDPNMFSNKE